jgi:predicted N-acetyltransferase YhbS
MSGEFSIRKYCEDDFSAYKELYNSVYGKEIDEDYIKWSEPLLYLAINEEGKIVGANSFFIRKLSYEGKEFTAVQSGDAMVLEEYRGNGILTKMISSAMGDLKEKGYSCIYGFANSDSYPSFHKLDFISLHNVNIYVKILNYSRMLKARFNKNPCAGALGKIMDLFMNTFALAYSKEYEIKLHDEIDQDLIDYISNCESDHIHIKKDKQYLEWKYKNQPGECFEFLELSRAGCTAGIFIVKVNKRTSNSREIAEFFIKNDNELAIGFGMLSRFYRAKDVDFFETWETGNISLEKVYKKTKLIKTRMNLYFIIKTLDEKYNFMNDFEAWHIFSGE